jgi:peroxiredoxin Q/BCP
VCTKEVCQFNDNLAAFQAAGVPVIGISRDDAQSHQRIGVLRSTFLVDEQGHIERVWHNVKADGHAAKVLEALGPKV